MNHESGYNPTPAERKMQEYAASATGNASLGVVIELCGGVGMINANDAIARAINGNINAFRTALGIPINELMGMDPDDLPDATFVALDEEDTDGIIPKFNTALELYVTAIREGLNPFYLGKFAEQRYAALSEEELLSAGVYTALIHYEKQWQNEAPLFQNQSQQEGS
jgi:hypothetical protein